MNSKKLQSDNRLCYEKFFQENEYVFSCPFVTNWSGDILGNYSGLSIRQKIPLRMYIGLSQLSEKEDVLGKLYYFDLPTKEFLTKSIDHNSPYFQEIRDSLPAKRKQKKYTINILSECSQSLGLGFTSIFSILLLTGLSYAHGDISHEDIINYKKSIINYQIQQKDGIVRELFKESITLDSQVLSKSGYTSKICSFFDGGNPVIGFREDNGFGYTDTKYSMNFYGYRINDLWGNIKEKPSLPYDFSIIYTGKPFIIESIHHSHLTKSLFNISKDDLREKFKNECGNLSQVYKPRFYKQLLEPEVDVIADIYGKMTGSISIEILYMFKEILSDNYSESQLYTFMYALNKFKLANNLTRINSEEFIKFINELESYLDIGNSNIALFPNDTTISGGCISIVSPIESSRKRILDFVSSKSEKNNSNIAVVYSSRQDGSEIEGFRIEQDIHNNISSRYTTGGKLKLISWNKNIHLKSYEDAIVDRNNDIIVDLIKNKIYIHGEICNSQELRSQSTTCELLYEIIINNYESVQSKNLSPSSYTKNKNEIITKVIRPFVNLIQSKLGKAIVIECSGYTSNYTIKSDFKGLKIGVLKGL